jgi:hypothetical protein
LFIKAENENEIEEIIPKHNYNPFTGNELHNVINQQQININIEEEDKKIGDLEMHGNNVLQSMLKNEELINK